MYYFSGLIAASLIVLSFGEDSALAQGVPLEQLCGKPPEFSLVEQERERIEGDVKGTVDVVKRFFGSGELGGRVKTERDRYYHKDPRITAQQKDAMVLFQVCTLLERDSKLSSREKIRELIEVRRALSEIISPAQVVNPQPIEPISFDGSWTVVTNWNDCRNSGRSFPILVHGGIISSTVAREMQGTIGPTGAIKLNYAVRDAGGSSWTNFMEGKIVGANGSGTAHSLGPRTDCRGQFEISRKTE